MRTFAVGATCPIFPYMDEQHWRDHEDAMLALNGHSVMMGVASRAPADIRYSIEQAARRAGRVHAGKIVIV